MAGEILEQIVAFEVAVEIVNLFEIVEVADHHRECGPSPAAARQFAGKMNKERAGVGQAGQIVGGSGVFRLLILERIFDGERDLICNLTEKSQVLFSEGTLSRAAKNQHTHGALTAEERKEAT